MKTFLIFLALLVFFVACGETSTDSKCPTCPMVEEGECDTCPPCEKWGDDAFVSKDTLNPDLLDPEDTTESDTNTTDSGDSPPDIPSPFEDVAEEECPTCYCNNCELIDRCELVALLDIVLSYESEEYASGTGTPGQVFWDVLPEMYCFEAVYNLKEGGLIDGYVDGTFKPESFVNRAEAIKIVVQVLGIANFLCPAGEEVFEDVFDGDWYVSYAEGAALSCLLCGTDLEDVPGSDGIEGCHISSTFKPSTYVDRGWLLTVLDNVENYTSTVPCDLLCHPVE